MLKRLGNYITLDVTDSNETKRTSVMVRMQTILMVTYIVLLIAPLILFKELQPLFVGAAFLGIYVIIFFITYRSCFVSSKVALSITYVMQGIWITLSFEGGSGGIFFIILSMMFMYLTYYLSIKCKVLVMILYCAVFVTVQMIAGLGEPLLNISGRLNAYIQIITGVALFLNSIAMLISFGHTTLSAEKKLMDYNREILEKASIDPLTKLLNRRAANSFLDGLIEKYDNSGQTFSIAIGDIDFFKKVNDVYGHNAGDFVLSKTADIIKRILGNRGIVARWGGEEFLIVFTDMNGDDSMMILENMRWSIQENFYKYNEEVICVTMTFGLTEYSPSDGIMKSIEKADDRLYYGKEHGRNRVVY